MQQSNRLAVTILASFICMFAGACPSTSTGGANTAESSSASTQGDASKGQMAAMTRACASCHGSDFSGMTTPYAGTMAYPPNLTPDTQTGLGEWTEDMIAKAILTGVDDEDEQLCPTMPVFKDMGMTDAEAHDLAAYLKSLPAVSKDIPESSCPPIKGGDESDQGSAGSGGM